MKFDEAVEVIRKLKTQPSNAELLELYGLYKQVTVGNCNTEKPGMLDIKNRAKWEQWNNLKDMKKEEAENKYVDLVQNLVTKYEYIHRKDKAETKSITNVTNQETSNYIFGVDSKW